MKRAIFILSLILTFVAASAQDDVFKRPIDRTFVCDKAEVFTQQQRTALTSKLQTFLRETSVLVLFTPRPICTVMTSRLSPTICVRAGALVRTASALSLSISL